MSITIKTDADIKVLREGGKLLARVLNQLEQAVRVGNTTLDIDDLAMKLLEENNLEPVILGYHPAGYPRPNPSAVHVSINDVVVHGIPNEDPIAFQEGDVVSIDQVIGYKGYVLDSARTVGVGQLAPQDAELLSVTRAALKAGIAAAQPGNTIEDIGRAVSAAVPEGFSVVRAFCGHGVGYALHEEPQVPNYPTGDKRSPRLLPGMVLAIEPIIVIGEEYEVFVDKDGYTALTVSGEHAAHMEHTVLITEKGPEVLTIV